MLISQFMVNSQVQLTFLTVILSNFDLVAYSVPEFLVFTLAWLLSDLAVLVHLGESVTERRKETAYLQSESDNLSGTSDCQMNIL